MFEEKKKGVVGKQSYSVSSSSGCADKERRDREMRLLINRGGRDQQHEQPPIRWLKRGWGGAYIHETLTVAEDNLTAGLLDVD